MSTDFLDEEDIRYGGMDSFYAPVAKKPDHNWLRFTSWLMAIAICLSIEAWVLYWAWQVFGGQQ